MRLLLFVTDSAFLLLFTSSSENNSQVVGPNPDFRSYSVQYKRSYVSSFDCFSCYSLRLRTTVLSVR